ncbi:tastin isoform X2 [Prionailurus iriomotensis]
MNVPSTPAEPHPQAPPGSAPTLWPHYLNGRTPW